MSAIIEWTHDAQCARDADPPRSAGLARWADDHLHGVLFQSDKEYDFFAAVAGFRNRFDRPSLYLLRGVPTNQSGPTSMLLDYFGPEMVGWLHLSEIERAITHIAGGDAFHMGGELEVGLSIMRMLVRKYGDEHVRMVFDIR